MKMDLGSLPTPPPPDRPDWLTLLILLYCGISFCIMVFSVIRHHWHRHKLRQAAGNSSASLRLRGEDFFCKRPPAKVVLPRKRGRGIR